MSTRREQEGPERQHSQEQQHRAGAKFLTATEVARILQVGLSTVYSWVRARQIPHTRLNGVVRFRQQDLDQWILDRSQPSESSSPPLGRTTAPARPPTVTQKAVVQAGQRIIQRMATRSKI